MRRFEFLLFWVSQSDFCNHHLRSIFDYPLYLFFSSLLAPCLILAIIFHFVLYFVAGHTTFLRETKKETRIKRDVNITFPLNTHNLSSIHPSSVDVTIFTQLAPLSEVRWHTYLVEATLSRPLLSHHISKGQEPRSSTVPGCQGECGSWLGIGRGLKFDVGLFYFLTADLPKQPFIGISTIITNCKIKPPGPNQPTPTDQQLNGYRCYVADHAIVSSSKGRWRRRTRAST